MCDYSLEGFKSRTAEVGDRLTITGIIHGFMTVEDAARAEENRQTLIGRRNWVEVLCLTCLKPGTRLDLTLPNGVSYKNVEFVQKRRTFQSAYRDYIALPMTTYDVVPVAGLPAGTMATVVSIDGRTLTTRGVEAVCDALREHDKTQPTVEVAPAK